jgi:3-oxoadipate enol-lactonase
VTARLHHTIHAPSGEGASDAPVLVLGGSLGTTLDMWNAQLPALAESFRVIAFDHRGHGGSDPQSAPCSIDDLGADLVGLLDELSLARVSYAGLSLGGMVGMWLAQNAPERINRLALLCTSANLDAQGYWHARAAAVRAGGMDAIVDPVVARWFTPAFATRRPDVVDDFTTMLGSADASSYAACCEAIGDMNLSARLGDVTAPTVVVAGREDRAIPVEHSRAIAGAIPNARLIVVPRAAHLANVEQLRSKEF